MRMSNEDFTKKFEQLYNKIIEVRENVYKGLANWDDYQRAIKNAQEHIAYRNGLVVSVEIGDQIIINKVIA